jgi:hypothetical protein
MGGGQLPNDAITIQLDGKLLNLALMRLSAHLKQRGELVGFRRISSPLMYASLIFERTRPIAERLRTPWLERGLLYEP